MESQESIAATSTTSVDDEDLGIDGLPMYLVLPDTTNNVLCATDVDEEEAEEGDGGDSDIEGDDFDLHDTSMMEALQERTEDFLEGDNDSALVQDTNVNSILLHQGILRVPANVTIPGTPSDWVAPAAKSAQGEPDFHLVDNPGNWSDFTFRPQFKTPSGPYICHALPTGATPVPETNGKRVVGDWEFHYSGWTPPPDGSTPNRSGATSTNLFPDSRKGFATMWRG